jgi:hypothetical protein
MPLEGPARRRRQRVALLRWVPAAPHLPGQGAAEQWKGTRIQLQEDLRELTALVRYLFTRHGVQIPVLTELLAQVEHHLLDLQHGLTTRQC